MCTDTNNVVSKETISTRPCQCDSPGVIESARSWSVFPIDTLWSFRFVGPVAESSAEVKLVLLLIARWLDCLVAFALECSSNEMRRSNVR